MNLTGKLRNEDPQINLFNDQSVEDVNAADLEAFLMHLAEELSLEDGFSVRLVDDGEMRAFNDRYAGADKATDVLSFPIEPGPGYAYLGDILISVETAARQQSHGLANELKVLALHGTLHLLGYDHESDNGEMEALEMSLRKEMGLS